jgi:hypothetical protein
MALEVSTKTKEIDQIMAHRNVRFLEAWKIAENGHNCVGRMLHSLQVLQASEGTLNLI